MTKVKETEIVKYEDMKKVFARVLVDNFRSVEYYFDEIYPGVPKYDDFESTNAYFNAYDDFADNVLKVKFQEIVYPMFEELFGISVEDADRWGCEIDEREEKFLNEINRKN